MLDKNGSFVVDEYKTFVHKLNVSVYSNYLIAVIS